MECISSKHSVVEIVSRIQSILEEKNIKCFSLFNHSLEADQVGLSLPDTQVIVFGDPKVGTALMQEDNRIAIALPLKMLVWEAAGKTLIGYDLPSWLGKVYALEKTQGILDKMDGLLAQIAREAAK
jgi:uncharacterized protein (DUF302 family)